MSRRPARAGTRAARSSDEEARDEEARDLQRDRPLTSGATIWDGAPVEECRLVIRTRERYAAVQELAGKGWTISAIGRKMKLDRRTVRKFARAETVEDLLTKTTGRSDLLTPYLPYLIRRFNNGCTDAARLTKEIQAQGYRGSPQTVRRHLQVPLRDSTTAVQAPSSAPTIREATRWITSHPDRLNPDDQARLADVRARSPRLDALADHVTTFATMMTTLTGTRASLDAWIAAADTDDLPALGSFARGLRRDYDASSTD